MSYVAKGGTAPPEYYGAWSPDTENLALQAIREVFEASLYIKGEGTLPDARAALTRARIQVDMLLDALDSFERRRVANTERKFERFERRIANAERKGTP